MTNLKPRNMMFRGFSYTKIKKSFMFNVDNQYDLPRDVVKKDILCQLIGKNELIIENYKKLLLFLSDEIKIQCKTFSICVKGENLVIAYYNRQTIIVKGVFHEISFL